MAMDNYLLKAALKDKVREAWIDLCISNDIDFTKHHIYMNDYGTRFDVQMPEIIPDEEE
tara:strand:+ start:382 stop:558 length:177 start_codon:yes stop_codon:yes gene_type:complete